MLKLTLALAGVAAAALAAAPASAENLKVEGKVAGYCEVRLANVSSGTASIAFEAEQKIANLEVACNQPQGTKLVVDPQNGDLTNTNGTINYSFRLQSSDPALNIPNSDATPGDTEGSGMFTLQRQGYSQAIAKGLPLQLFMNVNVANPSNQADSTGTPSYPANAAPAGTYSETFKFTVSSI